MMKKRVVRKGRKSFRCRLAVGAEERVRGWAYETQQHLLSPVSSTTHVIAWDDAREMVGVVLAEAGDEEDEGEGENDKCRDPRGNQLRIDDGWRHGSASFLKSTGTVRREV